MRQESDLAIKTSISDYWHKRSNTYDKFPVSRSAEEERSAYKNALSNIYNGNKLNILDVGTGTGFLALLLAEMGHKVTGLDLAEGMMEKAKNNARKAGYSINFGLGDAEDLPFEDESFDTVICRHLLWTLPDAGKALREWVRVIRTGGQIAAIEGKWRDASLVSRIKRFIKQLGILIHDGANPRRLGYRKEVDNLLPFRDGIAPEKAAVLFQNAGLTTNISVPRKAWKTLETARKAECPCCTG